jgi:hypothetical protein
MCVIWDKTLSVNVLPGVCIVCQFVLPRKLPCLLMCDLGLSRLLVCITEDMLPVCITSDIALSANTYYLGYCLICQCLLPGILPYLPVCITWDIALSASGCYLGCCLVCQCVLPGILRCLQMFAT